MVFGEMAIFDQINSSFVSALDNMKIYVFINLHQMKIIVTDDSETEGSWERRKIGRWVGHGVGTMASMGREGTGRMELKKEKMKNGEVEKVFFYLTTESPVEYLNTSARNERKFTS